MSAVIIQYKPKPVKAPDPQRLWLDYWLAWQRAWLESWGIISRK